VYVAGAPTSVCLERASLHGLDAARAPAPIGGSLTTLVGIELVYGTRSRIRSGSPGGTPWEYVLPPGATWRD